MKNIDQLVLGGRAFDSRLLTGTGKVATAVLVPLLSGFFFTARIAAGASARIGTMKRTNQVAALRMMGIRPADYLLTPLVWGMILAFTSLGATAGQAGPAELSEGISKALFHTLLGLCLVWMICV